MTSDELDLVATEDLVATLHRRYPTLVVLGVRTLKENEEGFVIFWRGGFTASLGLVERARLRFAYHADYEDSGD